MGGGLIWEIAQVGIGGMFRPTTWDHVPGPACRLLRRPILFGAFKWGARKKNGERVSEGGRERTADNPSI